MKAFLRRQSVVPFECLVAFLAVVSGGFALFHIGGVGADALSALLPSWLEKVVNALYALSGLAIWVGTGLGRRDVESFGLVTLATGVIARSAGLFAFIGSEPLVLISYFFNAAVILTCLVRLATLVRGDAIVRAKGDNDLR